jgi:hypothetical protein
VDVVCRDTRGAVLQAEQSLTHFPASPLVCLSWFRGMNAGLVVEHEGHGLWRSFGAQAVISGSQSAPVTSWAPTGGRAGMVCFAPDVARSLLGVDLPAVHDRFVDAHSALAPEWHPLLQALQALQDAEDDAAALAHDGGFADQAHMIRATRRITGFTPAEFARRFSEDESFWLYRLWV